MARKIFIWFALSLGTILLSIHLFAWIAPVAYLRAEAAIGFGPVSMPWAIERAGELLLSETYEYCTSPFLFGWHSSFGGGPHLPRDVLQIETEYEEIVLVRSGIIFESTKRTLDAMAEFNFKMLAECFHLPTS